MKSRTGFTLLELVLALAVLATIAAIAWPHLQPSLSRATYRTAALQLKSEFAEAREQAIHDGQVREFRLKPGTGRYLVSVVARHPAGKESRSRFDSRDRPRPPAAAETSRAAGITPSDPDPEFRELPGDMIFRQPLARPDPLQQAHRRQPPVRERDRTPPETTSQVESLEEVLDSNSHEWVLGVRFFPDGRATEEVIELEGFDAEHLITVHVRGLTGGVQIGPVVSIESEQDRRFERSPLTDAATNTKPRP